jgi:hypothetical protein
MWGIDSRTSRVALRLTCVLVGIAVTQAAWSQVPVPVTGPAASGAVPSDSLPPATSPSPVSVPSAAPGGGVAADFDTLMMLIQQTIDPDSWLLAGGQNTISPYPAGVYIDPLGHMKRIKERGRPSFDLDKPAPSTPQHPWRQASKLRTISLKQIDASLAESRKRGLQPAVDLLQLAGLSRITYVKVLVAEEDVLLAGPAVDSEYGFLLQDLATTASLISAQTAPMGCSIEPTNEGLLAAQQFLNERGVTERLGRNPRQVVEQIQEKVGAHAVRVFGMSPQSTTAIALLDADEHMKRVGFGTAVTNPPIRSYFDFLDEQTVVPKQSMIRWWFAFSDEPIAVAGSSDIFQLPENCVCVMSEQQWVSQQAVRLPTGARDEAADSFATEMSQHLPHLRKSHPSYARLCGVFETGLALQLAIETTGQADLNAWFPNLCNLGRALATSEEIAPPKTVEGLTTWHRLKSGTIVAVVSGGVKMDPKHVAAQSNWNEAKFLAPSSVPNQTSVPTSAHAAWWWDL